MKKIIAIVLAVAIVIGVGVAVGVKFIKKDDNLNLRTDFTIDAKFSDFQLGDEIFENIAADKTRWKDTLVTEYGLSESERDNLIFDAGEWLAFTLYIDVTNPNNENIQIHKAEIKDNGKEKVFICKTVNDCDAFEIPQKSTEQIYLNVLMHNPDPSLDEVYEIVKSMDINLYASVIPSNNTLEISDGNMITVKVQ